MTYKELQAKAKVRGIAYAKRDASGNVKWAPKHTLSKLVDGAPCTCEVCTAYNGISGVEVTPEREKPIGTHSESASNGEVKPSGYGDLGSVLGRAIDERVNAALTQSSAIQEQVKALRSDLEQAVKGLNLTPRTLEVKHPTKTVEIDGLTHECFDEVVMLASQRKNILLVGPAGCGKTHLAGQVAHALDLPFSFLSCSIGMSESQLLGWLLPLGDSGRFEYQPAAFVNAYENGGVFLLDEIDSADSNLLTILNAAIANGHLAIPQRHSNPIAVKHADFVLIAAANTYGHGADRVYAGRNQLDGATLDRFKVGTVTLGYDARIETQTVDPKLLEWGHNVRAKISENKLRRVMSTRFLQDASVMMKAYPKTWTVKHAQEVYFQDWTTDEKNKVPA